METLLSLTSKRAGDWFKEELRLLGGLDHIVDKGMRWLACICYPEVSVAAVVNFDAAWRISESHVLCCMCDIPVKECVQNLGQEDDKENLVASLWGAERCLRVLESVSSATALRPCRYQSPQELWLLRPENSLSPLLSDQSWKSHLFKVLFQICVRFNFPNIFSTSLQFDPPLQVTVQNPENQGYLIAYKDSQLIVSSARWAAAAVSGFNRLERQHSSHNFTFKTQFVSFLVFKCWCTIISTSHRYALCLYLDTFRRQ